MDQITLDNFRVFGSPASFDLAPVTVLTGKNNSGKSSLIKAFLVLADYLEQDDQTVLRLDGPRAGRYRISRFSDMRNWGNDNKTIKLSYQSKGYNFTYSFGERVVGGPIWLQKFVLSSVASGAKMELTQLTSEERDLLQMTAQQQAYRLRLEQRMLDHLLGPSAPWLTQGIELRMAVDEARKLLAQQEARVAMAEGLLDQFPFRLDDELVASEFAKERNDLQQLRDEATDAAARATAHERPAPDTVYKGIIYITDFHRRKRLLPNLIAEGLGRGFVEATTDKTPTEPQRQVEAELVRVVERELLDLLTLSLHHLGVNRTHQARLYLVGETKSEINAVAEAYLRLDATGGVKNEFLQHWAGRFDIGTSVRVRGFANTAINIVARRNGKQTNLVDMGFGSGQVFTILLQLATIIELQSQASVTQPGPAAIVLIEEPEANLHPQLQSKLAELFAEVAQKYGIQFILETHSEYLIRKLQLRVAQQEGDSEQAAIYYFDEANQRNITILPDGKLSEPFGPGFFDEADESAMQLFRLQKKAARTQINNPAR